MKRYSVRNVEREEGLYFPLTKVKVPALAPTPAGGAEGWGPNGDIGQDTDNLEEAKATKRHFENHTKEKHVIWDNQANQEVH